jgi:hypothetical protein
MSKLPSPAQLKTILRKSAKKQQLSKSKAAEWLARSYGFKTYYDLLQKCESDFKVRCLRSNFQWLVKQKEELGRDLSNPLLAVLSKFENKTDLTEDDAIEIEKQYGLYHGAMTAFHPVGGLLDSLRGLLYSHPGNVIKFGVEDVDMIHVGVWPKFGPNYQYIWGKSKLGILRMKNIFRMSKCEVVSGLFVDPDSPLRYGDYVLFDGDCQVYIYLNENVVLDVGDNDKCMIGGIQIDYIKHPAPRLVKVMVIEIISSPTDRLCSRYSFSPNEKISSFVDVSNNEPIDPVKLESMWRRNHSNRYKDYISG